MWKKLLGHLCRPAFLRAILMCNRLNAYSELIIKVIFVFPMRFWVLQAHVDYLDPGRLLSTLWYDRRISFNTFLKKVVLYPPSHQPSNDSLKYTASSVRNYECNQKEKVKNYTKHDRLLDTNNNVTWNGLEKE